MASTVTVLPSEEMVRFGLVISPGPGNGTCDRVTSSLGAKPDQWVNSISNFQGPASGSSRPLKWNRAWPFRKARRVNLIFATLPSRLLALTLTGIHSGAGVSWRVIWNAHSVKGKLLENMVPGSVAEARPV